MSAVGLLPPFLKMKSRQPLLKLERKTVDKNRRLRMKSLSRKLVDLIPNRIHKKTLTQQELLDQAAAYIRYLKEKLSDLTAKRDAMIRDERAVGGGVDQASVLPMLEVRDTGTRLDILLVTGPHRSFSFSDVVGILEEEGMGVVSANFFPVGDKIFHAINSQAVNSRIGYDSARVYHQSLRVLLNGCDYSYFLSAI